MVVTTRLLWLLGVVGLLVEVVETLLETAAACRAVEDGEDVFSLIVVGILCCCWSGSEGDNPPLLLLCVLCWAQESSRVRVMGGEAGPWGARFRC